MMYAQAGRGALPWSWAPRTCVYGTQCTHLAEGSRGLLKPALNKSDGAEPQRAGMVLRG